MVSVFWGLVMLLFILSRLKMVNSHLFFFGFLNDSLSLEMGFCPPSKSFHPKLELFKVKATSLGLRCHELFLGGKGIHSFLLLLSLFIFILVLVESSVFPLPLYLTPVIK